jgi:hypothetical protein
MKGRSFDTFQVASGNQEAYTVCRRIAKLEEMGPALVVLLGPEGCGKSHLLWAIAKELRAGTLPAGLVLITADAIPDKVKGLVEDSQPLQGRRAVLLVDELERFDSDARRLDAIVETFLACQHPVVIATNVHPNRLDKLTVPLVNRLAIAQVVGMESRPPETEGAAGERLRDMEATAQDLQRQRDVLRQQLEAAESSANAARAAADEAEAKRKELQAQAEKASTRLARLQERLNVSDSEKAAVESRVSSMEVEVGDLKRQLASASAAMEAALEEKGLAEAQIGSLRDDADYALAQQALLQGRLAASELASEDTDQVRDSLAATRERLKGMEFEWEKARKVLAIQTAEMDTLRNEAASQAALASIQAGELEQRIGALEAALEALRANRPEADGQEEEGATAWAMALENMQTQLAALREDRLRDGDELAGDEQVLFGADFFEALPDDFEVRGGDKPAMVLPGSDNELRDVVEGALGGPAADAEDTEDAVDASDER